jgi:hypothetical protein
LTPPQAAAFIDSTLFDSIQDQQVKEQDQQPQQHQTEETQTMNGGPWTPPRPTHSKRPSMDQEEWQTCIEETPKKTASPALSAKEEATVPGSSPDPSPDSPHKKQLEPEEEQGEGERYYELSHPNRHQRRTGTNDNVTPSSNDNDNASHSSSVSSLTFDQYEQSPSQARKQQTPASTRMKPLYPPSNNASTPSPVRRALEQKRQKSERLTKIREKVLELQAENQILKQKNQALLEARSHSKSMLGPAHGVGSQRNSTSDGGPSTARLNQIYNKVQEVTSENESLKQSKEDLQSQVSQLQTKLQEMEVQRQEQLKLQKSPSLDLSLYTSSIATNSAGSSGLTAARQKLDMATESVFSRVRSIAESRNALAKQREHYFSSKKNFESEGSSSRGTTSPPAGDVKTTRTGTPASAPVTSTDRNKANGLVITRKLNRSDRKVQHLTQRVAQLEYEQMEDKRKIQEARKAHQNDLQQVTQLELDSVQQRTLIASLKRQVKQKDQSIEALEDRVQDMGSEIMDLKELHELEQEELQNAYEELKSEAGKLVTWLKTQLAEYQGGGEGDLPFQSRDIPFSIDPARAQPMEGDDDSDLDSLTPSEKRTLLDEIAQERNQWLTTEGSVEQRVAALRADMIGSNSRVIIPELNQTFDSADEPSMF